MYADEIYTTKQFHTTNLPKIGKKVTRLGIAGNCGLNSDDALWAADQGANYWVYGQGFKKMKPALRELAKIDREKHIIALLGWGYFGSQIRHAVEKTLRDLKTDYLDVFKLGWLGVTSRYHQSTIDALVQLRLEGKIRAIGTSIHNRERAGKLVLDSEIDLFMIRYNAKHPGAEDDIFPNLDLRKPAVVSYTALAWTQLTKPVKNVEMPMWPGAGPAPIPLTPDLCYRFALSNPHVHVVLSAPKNRDQLKENLESLSKGPLNEEELSWIRKYGKILHDKKRRDYF
ncbi:oxidoreductase, aldo/keto reductase family [Verrucomicrobiia bacterium DG1235]|nr:oxidoreductase, aldo/keto reductase family [Verrucomicrobiae bacterium DG1235]